MTKPPPLKLRNLTASFKSTLFKDVSLEIHKSEFVTLMGKNGVGKTVLLECLMGVKTPDSGEILFWDKQLKEDKENLNKKIGWVPSQREYFPPMLTIEALMATSATVYPTWNNELCEKLISEFELNPKKRLINLSMGENSKVRLIKAISFEPDLLILDELTANLSEMSKKVILKSLIDLFSRNEMSVLYVSHSNEEALQLSDKILHLTKDGLKEKNGGLQ